MPFALVEESLPEAFIEHMKELTKWCASTKDFNIIHQPILLESRLKIARGIKQVYSHNEIMTVAAPDNAQPENAFINLHSELEK